MSGEIPTSSSHKIGSRPRLLTELLRISAYLLGLIGIYAERERLLPDTWLWLTLPTEAWHPSMAFFNSATLWEPFAVVMLYVLLLAFLVRFLRSIWTGRLLDMRPWLLLRAGLLGLSFLIFMLTAKVVPAGQQILDTRSAAVLTNLRPGLSQSDVETLILKANAAMLRPPERASVEGPDHEGHNLYLQLQEALARPSLEEPFRVISRLGGLNANGRLFGCMKDEGKARENGDHRPLVRCYRSYLHGSDPAGAFALSITFDTSALLQSARYEQSRRHAEPPCQILFDIPPMPGKSYPASCS